MNEKVPIVINTKDGGNFSLEPTCLIVFIDETGEEAFSDKNYAIFGLGGCAVLATDYEKI